MLSWLGLRSRLVVVMLLAWLPVFGLFAYSAAKSQQADVQQAQNRLNTEVLLAAAHQQRLVDRVAQLLGDIAGVPSVKAQHAVQCAHYLANLLAQDARYLNLGAIGLDGQVSCSGRSAGSATDASALPYFRRALATQQFSVGEYVPASGGPPGIAFSAPLYSSAGMLNGVVFAILELPVIESELRAGQVPDGAQLRVLDRQGVVLASYPMDADAGVPGRLEADAVLRQGAPARQWGARQGMDAGGVERVYAYAPVSGAAGNELLVTSSVPLDHITALPRQLLWADLAALLGLSALGAACAWAMGQRLVVNPARAMLREAQEIARGNLQARVWRSSLHQGELGQLGLAFNHMAESLQSQRRELDAALAHADKERVLLELILNSMGEGVIAVDNNERFLRVNASATRQCGPLQLGACLGDGRHRHQLLQLDGQAYAIDDRPLMQALRGLSVEARELVLRRSGAGDRVLRVSARPLLDGQARQIGALAVFRDVTALKAAQSLTQAQEQVLTLMAGSAPLHVSLDAIVRLVERNSPGSLCSVLLTHDGGLRHGAAPSLPQEFVAAIDDLPIGEGMGACGTAAFRKAQVVVDNVSTDPLMQRYRPLLLAHGLHACWSTPVLGGDAWTARCAFGTRAPSGCMAGRPRRCWAGPWTR